MTSSFGNTMCKVWLSNHLDFPLAPQLMEVEQKLELNSDSSEALKIKTALAKTSDNTYTYKDVEGRSLLHLDGKLYVPNSLRKQTIQWYHHYLCHPGGDRLAKTLQQVCTWRGINSQCRTYCTQCHACQKFKKRSTKYGKLESKVAETVVPWHTVCVDLIGTYVIKAKVKQIDGTIKSQELQLCCMTFIDPATGWFKSFQSKSSLNKLESS